MSKLPTVAIIGRPNTGKSTLFNRLTGGRRAIVSEVAGTTRDRVAYRIETPEVDYLLLDTGGIGGGSEDKDFEDDVSAQSVVALASADVILFTINSQEELTVSDYDVIHLLRKRKKTHVPILLVPTKCDNVDAIESKMPEYYALGISDDVVPVSAVHRTGVEALESAILARLQALHFKKEEREEGSAARIAIVGKPNVGKSSIINALMSEPQRAVAARLVSDIPGTTRDASDTIIVHEEKEYIFIDTAGLRRKARVEEDLEYLSNVKGIQALERSDVTLLVLDASTVMSKQDKRIASMAAESGKGFIVVVNKADLLSKDERAEKELEIRAALRFCRYAPILFVSATTKDGLLKLFPLIETVQRNRLRRIGSKDLIRWYETVMSRIPGQELARSKFITQAENPPPTFVIFVKNPKRVGVSQLRALENSMRATFAFEGAPIRWITKTSGKER